MAGHFNPRLLTPHDTLVLELELRRLGASTTETAAVRDRLPAWPILLEVAGTERARALMEAMREAGGAAVVSPVAGELLLVGNTEQYRVLRELAPEGEESKAAAAAWDALRDYFAPRGSTRIGSQTFEWGTRTFVMGIVNVTPDSFSGDGVGENVEEALAQARRFVEEGADIVDVGGESTRPNSERIDTTEELRRVLPVVERLAMELPVPVSIDTYKAAVAERCIDAGAALVNDIWGLRGDPAMALAISRRKVPVVLMHNQRGIAYRHLMADVIRALRESMSIARRAGIADEQIIVDPGIGFGKSKEQNLEILHRLDELRVLGRPLLLGTSRKSTIGFVLNAPPQERVEGTAATVALGIRQGADLVRVHDVREMALVVRMTDAVARWQPADEGAQHWPGPTG